MLDEFGDAAGEAELRLLAAALVIESDLQAFIEEGELAKTLGERVEAKCGRGENRRVGMKRDFCAGLARLAGDLELRSGNALFVGLLPDFAIAMNFEIEPVGERVDDGNADAVKAAGNFVGIAVEFPASMEDGHHHFGGGLFLGGVHVDGNAAAIVDDGYGIIFVDGDVDFVAEPGQRFVDGIVDDFPDEMMQAEIAGGTDVHRGTLANGFDAAEDFDGSCVVLVPRAFAGRSIPFQP